MDIVDALLDSWDRQVRILTAVGSRVDESNRKAKPSEDGWPLDHQLAHIHAVRKEWLSQLSPERGNALGDTFTDGWFTPIDDLQAIRSQLDASAIAIRAAVREALQNPGTKVGAYDHPVLFLQHMVWHEGWHVGLILLGLRRAGQEPPEEWEEAHIWGEWRTEEPYAPVTNP